MVVTSMVPVVVEEMGIPVIDLSGKRGHVTRDMVRACEEFGFFKVVGHGVPVGVVQKMEAVGLDFFSLPPCEKQKSGPPNPLGYGCRNIGFNGDTGEVEYLLLHANPNSIQQSAKSICSKDTQNFSHAVTEYVDAVKRLGCAILEMLGEGLGVEDRKVFSRLVGDGESDCLLRLNHYPAAADRTNATTSSSSSSSTTTTTTTTTTTSPPPAGAGGKDKHCCHKVKVGFGEHTDPQVLSLLRSTDVPGLQILLSSASRVDVTSAGHRPVWVAVPPDPDAFFVIVGDTLQVLTNGRFASVRHRAMTSPCGSRLSVVYFCAPPLSARIAPLPEMVTPSRPRRFRSFTWGEYKKALYSLTLGHDRCNFLRLNGEDARRPST